MSGELGGRRILVTGGSSGIGREIAAQYAAHGASVWTVSRRTPPAFGPGVRPIVADLAHEAGPAAVAAAVEPPLDVVVHAAGILGPLAPLADYPPATWDEVFKINMTAVQLLHQALVPVLAPDATIIGVSSTVGRKGRGGWGMYAVSKGALENWLDVLADEWEGKVYSVNPGGTATPMRAAAMPDEDPSTIPSPADIAPIFLRLAAAAAAEPTGSRFDARDWIGRNPWEPIVVTD